jgi:hypothetical protein
MYYNFSPAVKLREAERHIAAVSLLMGHFGAQAC